MKKSSRDHRKYVRIGKMNYRENLLQRQKYAKINGLNPDDIVIVSIGANDMFYAPPYIPYKWNQPK